VTPPDHTADDTAVAMTVPDPDPRRRERPAAVPAAGNRRSHPAPAHLRFFHGPMDCGKSTLALQVDHNQARQGRSGLLLTQGDRSGRPRISSRVGLTREALEVEATTDLRLLVRTRWADGQRVDYLIVDEAQFLTPAQVDQLAELVDESHVDVWAFGLTTDFRTRLFPGTQRLLEIADDVQRVQVEVLCWCGLPGLLNARVVDGALVRHGATVVVADIAPTPAPDEPSPGSSGDPARSDVHYQVLCRRHHVLGQLGPTAAGPGQLAFP
jgi:thymidine kinase